MIDEIPFLPEPGLNFTNDAPLLINQNTIGGVLPLETTVTNADLLATGFDVLTDHVPAGVTEVEFTVFNQGSEVARDFQVAVVYSEDEIIGNDDDLQVGTFAIAELGADEELTETRAVTIPQERLFAQASEEDLPGQGLDYVSGNVGYLALVIDPSNQLGELDESNNSNRGQGVDLDRITYFPWDVNDSGRVTPTDVVYILNRLGEEGTLADLNGDGTVTGSDVILVRDRLGYTRNEAVFQDIPEVLTVEISPTDGEEMVNLTRETIVRFGGTVREETVTPESFYLIANGSRVQGEIRVSSTGEFATFFYDEPLPPSTEVRVVVEGDGILAINGTPIDGDGDGVAGGRATADFRTLPLTQIEGTNVFGYVFDSFNRDEEGENIPVVGATVRVDALPELVAVTDEDGFFRLENLPAPEFAVHVDGSTAINAPEGTVYATVGKIFESVPGTEVQLTHHGEVFDIYLPPLATEDIQQLNPDEDTEVGLGEAGLAQLAQSFPDVEPSVWELVEVTIPAGSAQDDEGNVATQATIIPVDPDRLPGPLPPGVAPQLVISIQAGGEEGFSQAGGATNFDVPAPVTFPNLDGLAPGEQSLIWSFNHDAGDWEVIGNGTVSSDGTRIVSDEGVGILAPGWHFTQPGVLLTGTIEQLTVSDSALELARQSAALFLNSISFGASFLDSVPIFGQIPVLDQVLSGVGVLTGLAADAIDDGMINSTTWIATGLALVGALDPDPITGSVLDAVGLTLATQSLLESSQNTTRAGIDFFNALTDDPDDLSNRLDTLENQVESSTTEIERFFEGVEDIRQVRDAANGQATSDQQLINQYQEGVEKITEARDFFQEQDAGSVESTLRQIETDYQQFGSDFRQTFADSFGSSSEVAYSISLEDGTLINRGTTNASGQFSVVLPPNQALLVTVADSLEDEVVTTFLTTEDSGNNLLETFLLAPIVGTDTDGDSLLDEVENAIGTNPNQADTDGDGINDLAEIEQGLDPLGDRGFPTGIISSLPLQGEANAVVVEGSILDAQNQTAYVATGSHGLAIVDAGQFNNPIVLGQLDLAGDATDIAVDPNLQIAAVATNDGGLQLVDVSDPMVPTLRQTVNISVNQVEIFDGIAYATAGTSLRAIDLLTGEELHNTTLPGSGTVTGLAREGTNLYVYTSGSDIFSIIDIADPTASSVLGQLNVSVASSDVGVFSANGVAYLGGSGLRTIDIADPSNPTLISDADLFFTARNVTLNGSGLALVAAEDQGLSIYDVSNPEDTNVFVIVIDTPRFARNVAIASGIAYVADETGDLQVINYLPFDNQGEAPNITISSAVEDLDPETEGIQVTEGTSISIQANVSDDVQVRNVELLVNGEVVSNDLSFPFELEAIALSNDPDAAIVEVQARATDTGGNTALSNLLAFDLVPDTFAPVIESITPADGGTTPFNSRRVTVRFNEALAEETVTAENFQLLDADGEAIRPENIQLRSGDRTVQLTYKALSPGEYSIVINSSQVTDRAGNPLGEEDAVSLFTVTRLVEFNLSDLNGSNGFVLNGIDSLDGSGGSVSGAGDINGDGFDDLIIGAAGADPNFNGGAGETYVFFGSPAFG